MRYLSRILILLSVLLLVYNTTAQTILLKQVVSEDFSVDDGDYGPNRKFFTMPFFGVGFGNNLIDYSDETPLRNSVLRSPNFYSGTRYMYNAAGLLALIGDINLGYRQAWTNREHAMPDSIFDFDKARYSNFFIGGSAFIQFNFMPKRGNQLGKYIQLGGFGEFAFFNRFILKGENTSGDRAKISFNLSKRTEPLQYGFAARLGFNNMLFFGRFYISDYFKDNASIVPLPRTVIGIQFFTSSI